MKTLSQFALLAFLSLQLRAAQPWQEVTMPTVAEAAASFANPPKEYGAIHWALGFPPSQERIQADIERIAANGGGGYMINSGGRSPKYLSPEYLALWKFALDQCKKHGLKMWIDGDDGYPDGFAGGMISKDYPQLGMQGIIADAHYTVAAGQALNIPLPAGTVGILASARSGAPAPGAGTPGAETATPAGATLPLPADGQFKWTAPGSTVSGADRFLTWEVNFQGSAGDARYSVVCGQTLSIPVPTGTRSILASPATGGRGRGGGGGPATSSAVLPLPADDQFKWAAPNTAAYEITFIRHVYRSSPTRAGQREDGSRDKDSLYSLIDYLDPDATAAYLKLVMETYAKAGGDEFGKTMLGFRGDETDYTGFMPWTPKLLDAFQKQKGYDLKPYIAQFFAPGLTPEAQRARADYWDVWSGMFRDNFYKQMADWCQARNMLYMLHLNHEETMTSRSGGESMTQNEGSFWRDMRYIGVPGVDNLSQIGPGIVADFPKLAGSTAHLFGRPQAWSEAGGEPGQAGKFVFDYQLVRGLNYMNIRGLNAAPAAPAGPWPDPSAAIGWYVSRAQHMMAIGRPAAQVALYHPTDSFWMGDQEADTVTVKLVTQLLERQVDFDHIDHESLASICALDGGGLKNLSGQVYRAVIVPTSLVIQKAVLERLRAFAGAGGKVIFVGRTPTMVVDRTFMHPEPGAADLSFATLEPSPEITARVLAALPPPDVKLDTACPTVKYMHRNLKDGEVYFFFNESNQTQSRTATLAGAGQVQVWDATRGTIHPLAGVAKAAGSVAVPLTLGPQEARFIVIGPLPAGARDPAPAVSGSKTEAELGGDWSVTLGEKQLSTPLKTWEEMGVTSFTGTGIYKKQFTLSSLPQGVRFYLDLGTVHEDARVLLNGTEFEARPWPPYLWDVTGAIKSDANTLEVQVRKAPSGEQRGGGAGGAGAAGGAAAGARRGRAAEPGPAAAAPRGSAPAGGRRGASAAAAATGLLGPVRVLAQ